MSDPLYSSKYSLARAKHHVGDFERQIAEFIKTNPYGRVVEVDPNTAEEVYKIKLTKPLPVALDGIAVDAINNLRSALDQTVYALKTSKKGMYAYFPIRNTEPEFKNAVNGICKDVPKEIVDLLTTFKPYKGGNNSLWALNKLAGTNKHGIICPVAAATGGVHFQKIIVTGGFSIPAPVWDRAKNEMEFLRVMPGSEVDANIGVTTFVAFRDVEGVDGAPAVPVLNQFVSVVEGVIMAIEAEARRLGLI